MRFSKSYINYVNLKKSGLILIVLLFLIQEINAQSSIDLLTISGRYGFPQNAGAPVVGKNSEYGTFINLKLPIVFSEKAIWYNNLTYVGSHVESDASLLSNIANAIDIHGFVFQTGMVVSLNEKQKLQLLLAPRFMTDFENVTLHNWQLGGVALFENTFSENLLMRFGALFNQELFGPSLTPLIHIDWIVSPKWSVSGMLPIFLKINYKVNEDLIAGFSHFALVTSYRLGNLSYEDDYIERASIDLTLFVRQRILNNLFVEGRYGYAVGRKYAQYTQDQKLDFRLMIINFGDNRVEKNRMMSGGPIANVRLVYNLPLD